MRSKWMYPGHASGFVDQHITHFMTNGGVTAALASCMIADVRDGSDREG